MQNQVRFYITQDDDQAVVRTIPVRQHVTAKPVVTPVPDVVKTVVKPAERLNVAKLVRAVVKPGGPEK